MRPRCFLLQAILIASLSAHLHVIAGNVGLVWQPSPGATGYLVFYGTSPTQLTNSVDVGNVTSASLVDLADCQTWYFAVKAYNAGGKSDFSETVASWPRPTIQQASATKALQGSQLELTLNGSNFRPETELRLDNLVTFDVRDADCESLTVEMTVEPTAEDRRPALAGEFDITVADPGGARNFLPFEVLIDRARFDVDNDDESAAGLLDGRDIVRAKRRFGSQDGSAEYDPRFDFNGDGWIDGEDFTLLNDDLGGCWNGEGWIPGVCIDAARRGRQRESPVAPLPRLRTVRGSATGVGMVSLVAEQGASAEGSAVSIVQESASDDLVTVRIAVQQVAGVYGAAFDLVYPASNVSFVDWSDGDALDQDGNGPTYHLRQARAGRLVVAVARTGPEPAIDVTEVATLFRLTFRVEEPGTAPLVFRAPALYDGQLEPQPIPAVEWFGATVVGN